MIDTTQVKENGSRVIGSKKILRYPERNLNLIKGPSGRTLDELPSLVYNLILGVRKI